jgi:crotonobetainyl-CoA:carnitine CoA-transferase CaiB-like acyl-CoA transferase
MAAIRETQTGRRPGVAIDVRGAAAAMRSSKYVLLDGKPPAERHVMTGFYRVAQGRWNYFHCNHPPHQAALLRVLGAPAERAKIAEAALQWNAFELEQAVDLAGGCAPAVRTPGEWRALPNTPYLAAEPLLDIRKIADSPPVPLPAFTGAERPLAGLRVLDLTRVLAGPSCARILSESAAEVLKVTCGEHPDTPALELDTGYGKRKATIEIATPAGREQFTALMRRCDVFSQAYRQGAMAKLGFSHDQVAALRPGIVYASLNAFGYSGPWRERRGFDTVVQSASGMAWVQGRGKEPQLLPVSALDYIGGYLMAYGVLVALRRRHEEGGSYAVNVSLARCSEWLNGMGLLDEAVADSGAQELEELQRWLIEVDTPLGRLKRLRPVIRYSEELLNTLPPWREHGATGAVWAG